MPGKGGRWVLDHEVLCRAITRLVARCGGMHVEVGVGDAVYAMLHENV